MQCILKDTAVQWSIVMSIQLCPPFIVQCNAVYCAMYCIVSCSAVHTAVPPLCHPRSSLSNSTYGFTSIENAAALSSSTSASTSVFSELSWKILWLCIKNPTYTSWWIKSKCSALAMWVWAMHPWPRWMSSLEVTWDRFWGHHLMMMAMTISTSKCLLTQPFEEFY